MAVIVKCLDSFRNPRELTGAAVRDGLLLGVKRVRKFIVFASPGEKDVLVVIGPPIDPDAVSYPRFYFHKNIRTVAEELYHRTDIAGGGQASFTVEEVNGVRQETAVFNGKSSDFGAYPSGLAEPDGVAALVAWCGAPVVVA